MILTPSTSAPGAAITATGRAAKKRSTRIRIDGILVLGFKTGGNGQYARTITVPKRPDGEYDVTVEQLTDAWRQVDHADPKLTIKNPVVEPPPPPPPPDPEPEPEPPPPVDPAPTVTFGPNVSDIGQTTAKITWTVSKVATGWIEYGPTLTYGKSTPAETSFDYASHVQTLGGLPVGQLCYFRVVGKDQAGLPYSKTGAFTTLGAVVEPTPEPEPEPTPEPSGLPPVRQLASGALPSIPALPPVGVSIDTPLGTKLVRITANGSTPDYCKSFLWNADGTLIQIAAPGVLVDPKGNVRSTAMGNPGRFNFDPKNPRLGYATQSGDPRLYRWDLANLASPQRTAIKDFGRPIDLGRAEGGLSDDGWAALIDGVGNVFTYNIWTGQTFGPWPCGGNPNSLTTSRDGRLVVVVFESSSTGRQNQVWVFNRDGSGGRKVCDRSSHCDTAVSTTGNQVLVMAGAQMWNLETGVLTNLLGANASSSGHVSGRGPHGLGVFSVYDTAAQAGRPGNDQVFGVDLVEGANGNAPTRPYTFANRRGTSYDTQPQAIPSRDGSLVLFASDWGNAGSFGFVAGMAA